MGGYFEIMFILFLIIGNGVLAMSEIAIVSSRKSRIQALASRGNKSAQIVLDLSASPNRFLSTVQIGITLVGIFAGAFGGATIAEELNHYLQNVPLVDEFSESLSLAIVVIAVTYLSLVVGELIPKRLALQNPEKIALLVARPMVTLSRLAAPLVWLLGHSTEFPLKIFRIKAADDLDVTEEDVRTQIRIGTKLGVFHKAEQDMLERVLHLEDLRVSAVMTPRPDIEWLDVTLGEQSIQEVISRSAHSNFPVGSGRLNNFQGLVSCPDLLKSVLQRGDLDIKSNLKNPMFVVESATVLKVLEQVRKSPVRVALVVDEYGTITGLITLYDLLQAIIGQLPPEDQTEQPLIVQRDDGTWLVDGMIPIYDFKEYFQIEKLTGDEEEADYNTLAGFILSQMGQIPKIGDHFQSEGIRYEVVDMDRHRIDRILVSKVS